MALIVTRREVRDSFRDWRIIIPIVVLTLVFPGLATLTAEVLFNFTRQFGAELVGDRLVPFMLLIVGFFPMSFSLVIALETFVGEKERKSLEPLLATPLTNTQLYVGKVLAAIIPPMATSYLGILVYLIGLAIFVDWFIPLAVMVQIISLSTIQGVIMVASAVIVSSQTTSVRAANLLASFIIVPTAMLLQFESIVLFWGNYSGLWWLVLALLVTAAILVRMGIQIFNREELLGQDIDQLKLRLYWRLIWNRFTCRSADGTYPNPIGWYRQLFSFLPELSRPAGILLIALAGAGILGQILTAFFPVAENLQTNLENVDLAANIAGIRSTASLLAPVIFMQNLRAVLVAAFLGIFTLGVTDVMIFMLPWTLISYLGAQLAASDHNPLTFIMAAVVPHALIELPALILIGAATLRWHATVLARPPNRTVGESWLLNAADFGRVLVGLGLPLLFAAALVEALITPSIVFAVYGG